MESYTEKNGHPLTTNRLLHFTGRRHCVAFSSPSNLAGTSGPLPDTGPLDATRSPLSYPPNPMTNWGGEGMQREDFF